jgi:hypothetical protein
MNMKRRTVLSLSAITALGLAMRPTGAVTQQKTLKEQIVGTWMLVSSDTVQPNGTRSPTFGPTPAIFDSSGHYALVFTSSTLPKFAANNRTVGTAEENKAVVQGSLAHFGTYTVNEADRSFTLRIESSSFPNWTGTEQKRPFTVLGDDLKYTTPAASGGSAELVWKRAK